LPAFYHIHKDLPLFDQTSFEGKSKRIATALDIDLAFLSGKNLSLSSRPVYKYTRTTESALVFPVLTIPFHPLFQRLPSNFITLS